MKCQQATFCHMSGSKTFRWF